jgi:hypothetical protein
MATGLKVTTRSMSKGLDSTSETNSALNNRSNKGKTVFSTEETITLSASILVNSNMDIDFSFQPTGEPGVQEIIFQDNGSTHRKINQPTGIPPYHFATSSHSNARKSPVGFSSDTEDESQSNTSNNEQENNPSTNKKPPREAYNRPPTDWQVEYGRKRYKMVIEADKLPGNNDTQKVRNIAQALVRLESLTSTKMVTQNGIKMIVAIFGAQKDTDKTKNLTLLNNSTIQMKEAQMYNAVEAKYKTIHIWDIPLDTNQNEIKETFTKFGEISNIRINTIGMWQSGNIEFTNKHDYEALSQKWAVPFKADLIRIFPFICTNKYKKDRDRFTLKITNLPPGTTGYDLNAIIKCSNAKTCYIPRNINYTRKRYAVLSFKDQEDNRSA